MTSVGLMNAFSSFLKRLTCVRAKRLVLVRFLHIKVVHLQGRTVRRQWIRGRIEYNISLYKIYSETSYKFVNRIFGIQNSEKHCGPSCPQCVIPLLLHRRTRGRIYLLSDASPLAFEGMP